MSGRVVDGGRVLVHLAQPGAGVQAPVCVAPPWAPLTTDRAEVTCPTCRRFADRFEGDAGDGAPEGGR